MAPLIDQARARGVHIIHSPSDTLDVLSRSSGPAARHGGAGRGAPFADRQGVLARQGSRRFAADRRFRRRLRLPAAVQECQQIGLDRQHPAITIADDDIISDNGQEVYNYLVQQGIKNVIYVGVHTNMCVLGRSFGIRQMTTLGFNTVLVRDLTDTMYNPRKSPFVEHAAGTDLVVKHVERHWCPSTTSAALAEGLR